MSSEIELSMYEVSTGCRDRSGSDGANLRRMLNLTRRTAEFIPSAVAVVDRKIRNDIVLDPGTLYYAKEISS